MSDTDKTYPINTEAELQAHVLKPMDPAARDRLEGDYAPDDIIISTFPKCGTTWTGQIAHGLRSKGDMSFASLSDVFPWLEMGYLFKHNFSTTRQFTPSLYKSHMELSQLPRGVKVINIIRNPADTLLSYYNFWSGVLINPQTITPEMMANQLFFQDRQDAPVSMHRLNYFQHLVDFHYTEYDGQVLMIAYEDMKLNLPAAVRRIARFMGIDLSKTLERKVVEQSTIFSMKQHKEKYNEVVPFGVMEMVATGRVGDGKAKLSPELLTKLDEAWAETVTPYLGYENYERLRQEISL